LRTIRYGVCRYVSDHCESCSKTRQLSPRPTNTISDIIIVPVCGQRRRRNILWRIRDRGKTHYCRFQCLREAMTSRIITGSERACVCACVCIQVRTNAGGGVFVPSFFLFYIVSNLYLITSPANSIPRGDFTVDGQTMGPAHALALPRGRPRRAY